MLRRTGITAPPTLIPTIQYLLYLNNGMFEKLIPVYPSIIPVPSKNETNTIIIASSDENPILRNAFVTTK
jgi:hypothetical protein